jgi:hypothetical protein
MTVNAQLQTRNRYVRTDATTEYFQYPNQHWAIYDPGTSRFFVTDPITSHVYVLDDASETEIAVIEVPGAYGIDETPDHSTLYVGTLIGDVYAIDPVAMAVTQRYLASGIGPGGYPSVTALALADGQLALLTAANGFGVWNPTTNALTTYEYPCGNNQLPATLDGFALTADRKKIIAGISGSLCEVNPANGTYVSNTAAFDSFSYNILVSPDGKYIILPAYSASQAVLFDQTTLAQVAAFDVLGDTSGGSGFFISSDSQTLYTPNQNWIYAYNIATQQPVGWVSNLFVPTTSGGFVVGPSPNPYFLATDGTGLFAGPLEEGVGFVDLSSLQPLPVGSGGSDNAVDPAVGPASGGTGTQFAGGLGTVYFGTQQAFNVTANGSETSAFTPPGSPGPVPVYDFMVNGGLELIPDGFTYGPTVLETTPNMATAEGGGTGYIYGYGFGPIIPNTLPPYPIPSDLQVSVGASAMVTAYSQNPLNEGSPPFPLESAAYTVPPGSVGSANLTVTTGNGTTTQAGFTYLPAIETFPLAGSSLAQGIYDPHRDLYYFTDTNEIQVFSRTQGQWLTPITIKPPQGATQELWGIALSPDGSNLAVSDASAGVIYLLDPSHPGSVQTFAVPTQITYTVYPSAVVVSDAGNIYYAVFAPGEVPGNQFYKLNSSTGAITSYGIMIGGGEASDKLLRGVISSDNARVFFSQAGEAFYIDTATDTVVKAAVNCSCTDYELALSSDLTRVTAGSFMFDYDLNAQSYETLNLREILNIAYVYGAKFSPDGRLLFQPSTNGIDVFDGYLGNLLARVSLSVALSPNYDALVSDGTDSVLVAITGTGNGIAVVNLTSIPEPPALPYNRMRSRTGHTARGQRTEPRSNIRKGMRVVPHLTGMLQRRAKSTDPI